MRIAYVCTDPGIPLWGDKGAANHVREFVAALDQLGHRTTLFVARTGDGPRSLDVPVRRIRAAAPRADLPSDLQRETSSLDRNDTLRDALEKAHSKRPFDLVYERYSLWSYSARNFASLQRLPYCLEVNAPLRVEQARYRDLQLDSAAGAIESLLFSTADVVVGVSTEVVDYVLSRVRRNAPTITVPNGVDLALFHTPPAYE